MKYDQPVLASRSYGNTLSSRLKQRPVSANLPGNSVRSLDNKEKCSDLTVSKKSFGPC